MIWARNQNNTSDNNEYNELKSFIYNKLEAKLRSIKSFNSSIPESTSDMRNSIADWLKMLNNGNLSIMNYWFRIMIWISLIFVIIS